MVDYIEPMKAKLSDTGFLESVSDDTRWGAGEKFDGFRELLYLEADHNLLLSSGGNNHLPCVPQFNVVIPELAGTIVDCEGLSPTRRLEDNSTCFKSPSYPQYAIQWQQEHGLATLVVFDILRYKGQECMGIEFEKRRVLLKIVVDKLIAAGMPVRMEQLVMTGKLNFFYGIIKRTREEGHEGIILKDMKALYYPMKRANAWLKVKRFEILVYPICGFMGGTGKYTNMVGAVCYGDNLGTASGMDDAVRQDMTDHPEKYKGKLAYFKCQEITDMGVMRHPDYLRLLTPEEVKAHGRA